MMPHQRAVTHRHHHTPCIIIFRNAGNGVLGMICDGESNFDDPHVFANQVEAQEFASKSALRAWNHQIIEVEI